MIKSYSTNKQSGLNNAQLRDILKHDSTFLTEMAQVITNLEQDPRLLNKVKDTIIQQNSKF